MKNILLASLTLMLLGGCSNPAPLQFYQLPDQSIPSAHISINEMYGHLEREEWSCNQDGTSSGLEFYRLAKPSKTKNEDMSLPGEVDLPAGESVFYMLLRKGDYSCSLHYRAQLEAGENYRFTASIVDDGLLNPKKCVTLLMNTKTGKPVELYRYVLGRNERIGNGICRVRMEEQRKSALN